MAQRAAARQMVPTQPANFSLPDHIKLFDNALSAEHCRALIARFEAVQSHEDCHVESGHSFMQLDVTRDWPDEHQILLPILLSHFGKYQAAVNARFWPPRFSFENLRLKRYLPNGRDQFPPHVDVMCQAAARRFMTAIVYLNAPMGGETVFPELDIAIAPRTGALLAFPPLWLFPHAGLPPQDGPKYILHTYLCYPV